MQIFLTNFFLVPSLSSSFAASTVFEVILILGQKLSDFTFPSHKCKINFTQAKVPDSISILGTDSTLTSASNSASPVVIFFCSLRFLFYYCFSIRFCRILFISDTNAKDSTVSFPTSATVSSFRNSTPTSYISLHFGYCRIFCIFSWI